MKLTLRKAVDANCIDCTYDTHEPGTHNQQVEDCTITECHLWEHRRLTSKTKAKIKQDAYDAMTSDEQQEYLRKQAIVRDRFNERMSR